MLKILSQRSKLNTEDARFLLVKERFTFFLYKDSKIPHFMDYVQVIIKDAKWFTLHKIRIL